MAFAEAHDAAMRLLSAELSIKSPGDLRGLRPAAAVRGLLSVGQTA